MEKGFRLTLNITYHPAFSKLKHILNSIHVLLAPNTEHQNVFPEVPLVGFKKGKSLKDILVRAKVRKEVLEKGFSKGCGGKRCQVCKYVSMNDLYCLRIYTFIIFDPQEFECTQPRLVCATE